MTYVSNFKPIFESFWKKRKRIVCKNFILFLLLFNYFKINNIFYKVCFFFKPKYKTITTLLRAPYRYKLSRDQLKFCRYHILCSFRFFEKLNFFFFSNFNDVFIFIQLFLKIFPNFESNLCFQQKLSLHFFFFFKDNFLLEQYH